MKSMPWHLNTMLAPLMLALAVGQACAGEVVRTGAHGAAGNPGWQVFVDGTNGGTGESVTEIVTTSDAVTTLAITGGHGGAGGDGLNEMPWPGAPGWPMVGHGGDGGHGGAATGRVTSHLLYGPVRAETYAVGGDGGRGGRDGCCTLGSGTGGAGGAASSMAEAITGSGGAVVVANAVGGNGSIGRDGGAATANGNAIVGGGSAIGRARAEGGHGGSGQSGYGGPVATPGSGGNATASLSLTGTGVVDGQAYAAGGRGGDTYPLSGLSGTASATLALRGAGAIGTSTAIGGAGLGGGAISTAQAVTSGRAAVDMTAIAQGGIFSPARATVTVNAGSMLAESGNATVTGWATASGGPYGDVWNLASVDLTGRGDVVGSAESRGYDMWIVDGCFGGCAPGGSADAAAIGTSLGSGNVTLTALGVGGAALPEAAYLFGGGASSTAIGRSVSGSVHVKAETRSYRPYYDDGSSAFATATTLAAGGSSHAEAKHVSNGSIYRVYSEAASFGSGGAMAVSIGQGQGGALYSRADASDTAFTVTARSDLAAQWGNATASSAANVGGSLYALPAGEGVAGGYSFATGMPSQAAIGVLLSDQQTLQEQGSSVHWIGAGALGVSGGSVSSPVVTTRAQYGFQTLANQHLLLGLFGGQSVGTGAYSVDFSIIDNGVPLFTRYVAGDELTAFFNDRLLDLGTFGSGWQDLEILAVWSGYGAAVSGFSYVLGASVVPEPATWLAMLLGLGTVLLVRRRRR